MAEGLPSQRRAPTAGFAAQVGMVGEAGHPAGTSEVRLAVGPEHLNHMGVVHGGVLATLADEAIGRALISTLPGGVRAVTVELHVHYLLPGRKGHVLVARGQCWRKGRHLLAGEAVIEAHGAANGHDGQVGQEAQDARDGQPGETHSRIVARADGTWMVIDPRPGLPD